MLQEGIWENPSPGNEGINLIFHIHLEIRNDSAWVSRLLWREWHLINYGSVLKRETNKKKKKTKSILRKDKKDTSSCSKGTNQKKKKRSTSKNITRNTDKFVKERNRFLLSPKSEEYTVFHTAIAWGEGVGGREHQNPNKSQGIKNPLMTAE